jgi:hypothetical protein
VKEIRVTDLLVCRQFIAPEWLEAKALVGRMMHQRVGELEEFANCEKEFDISVEIDDVLLKGRIDIACLDENVIYEVKPKTKNKEQLKRYVLQVQLYGNMYERVYGIKPELFIVFYNNDDIIKQKIWYQDVLSQMERDIVDLANLMSNGIVYIRNPFCGICEARSVCPLYNVYKDRQILFIKRTD